MQVLNVNLQTKIDYDYERTEETKENYSSLHVIVIYYDNLARGLAHTAICSDIFGTCSFNLFLARNIICHLHHTLNAIKNNNNTCVIAVFSIVPIKELIKVICTTK